MTDDAPISVRDLTLGYAQEPAVITRLSLEVESGACVALTGPSGSGKSTLLYALAGLIRPRSGSITALGRVLGDLDDGALAAHRAARMGFVFQDALLDPSRRTIDSVMEVALYAGISRKQLLPRARVLLQAFGLQGLEDRRPGQVSGGQAQRIGLARALVLTPPLVFADEPTGNLDREAADVVLNALVDHTRANGGATIIATHDPRVAERCDQVVRL